MMIDTQDTVGIRPKHTKDTVSGAVPSVYHIFALEWVRQRGARTARRTRLQGCAKRSARRCRRAISAPWGGAIIEGKSSALRDGGIDPSVVCARGCSRIHGLPWVGCWRRS